MSIPIASTIEAASSAVVVIGAVYAIGRFSGRVDENTRATDRLTAAYERQAEKTDEKLSDHETRITVIETRLKK